MFEISPSQLDAQRYRDAVEHQSCGALLVFEGIVRDNFDGRPVRGLEYQAYPELALKVMEQITAELHRTHPKARVAMAHRTGTLSLGEVSMVIAVATPHRAGCYDASRFLIEALKERLPVWKKELFADGDSHWKPNDPETPPGPGSA